MAAFLVRVWLPDRPGALGAVASRIGSVRGDLIGIDILERGAGRVIDELVVELADPDLVDLLVREIAEVDGVDVESVAEAPRVLRDPRLDALETAAILVEHSDPAALLAALVDNAAHDFDAAWVAVCDQSDGSCVLDTGETPPVAWLAAFLSGTRTSSQAASGDCGPADVAWAPLAASGLDLVLGRRGRPFRARERRQLAALGRIAGSRWLEVAYRTSRRIHPSVCSG